MSIEQLVANLNEAQSTLRRAQGAVSQAQNAESDALNACNKAQKSLDEHLAQLRKDAPRGTDWHRIQNPGVRVPA